MTEIISVRWLAEVRLREKANYSIQKFNYWLKNGSKFCAFYVLPLKGAVKFECLVWRSALNHRPSHKRIRRYFLCFFAFSLLDSNSKSSPSNCDSRNKVDRWFGILLLLDGTTTLKIFSNSLKTRGDWITFRVLVSQSWNCSLKSVACRNLRLVTLVDLLVGNLLVARVVQWLSWCACCLESSDLLSKRKFKEIIHFN